MNDELLEVTNGGRNLPVKAIPPAEIRAAAMNGVELDALRERLKKNLNARPRTPNTSAPARSTNAPASVETRRKFDTAGRVLRVTGGPR
jgi:hypothetical protein